MIKMIHLSRLLSVRFLLFFVGSALLTAYFLRSTGKPSTANALDKREDSSSSRISFPPGLPLNRPYLFIHVPKSGGTAIGKLAELPVNGGPKFIRYWHHPREQKVLSEMVTKDFVLGHFKYGIHSYFKQPCTYMTFLRDPIDRVVSHYYFHLASTTDRFHPLARDNPIEKWVEISMDGQNNQVQFISGFYGRPNQTIFDIAVSNIKTFGFVGLYERFDESIVMLRYFAGFESLMQNRTKATTTRPKVQDLSPTVIEKISNENSYDIKLYAVAKEIFEQQIKLMGPNFQQEVSVFRQQQKLYQEQFGCVECVGTAAASIV